MTWTKLFGTIFKQKYYLLESTRCLGTCQPLGEKRITPKENITLSGPWQTTEPNSWKVKALRVHQKKNQLSNLKLYKISIYEYFAVEYPTAIWLYTQQPNTLYKLYHWLQFCHLTVLITDFDYVVFPTRNWREIFAVVHFKSKW